MTTMPTVALGVTQAPGKAKALQVQQTRGALRPFITEGGVEPHALPQLAKDLQSRRTK